MELIRKPFQGVINIIRFNWHFYVLAGVFIGIALLFAFALSYPYQPILLIFVTLATITIAVSLGVSHYAYDRSPLYAFNWLPLPEQDDALHILNLHAGFDETSALLRQKFPHGKLSVIDFYDPQKHREPSIRRARKAYPPYPGTLRATTGQLPLENGTVDRVFVILSAHEIRDERERIEFFRELNRIMKPGAVLYVTEHLRDIPNFLAYTIGFLHFHSHNSWMRTFREAGFRVEREIGTTPFISTFLLHKNGNTL